MTETDNSRVSERERQPKVFHGEVISGLYRFGDYGSFRMRVEYTDMSAVREIIFKFNTFSPEQISLIQPDTAVAVIGIQYRHKSHAGRTSIRIKAQGLETSQTTL